MRTRVRPPKVYCRLATWQLAVTLGGLLQTLFGTALQVQAEAITYDFQGVTFNNEVDTNIGVEQLAVTVSQSDASADLISFRFTNTGTEASSITDIYFDDEAQGLFDGIDSILVSAGVKFSPELNLETFQAGENWTTRSKQRLALPQTRIHRHLEMA